MGFLSTLFGSGKKPPKPPAEIGQGTAGIGRVGKQAEALSGHYGDYALSGQTVAGSPLGNISNAMGDVRSALGAHQNYIGSELAPLSAQRGLWNQVETQVASDALGNPASPLDAQRIASRKQEAFSDAMSGMRMQRNADLLRSKAAGLGASMGGATWDASRGGFMAGVAANTAGQQERMYLQGQRQALLPYASRMRQTRLALSRMAPDIQKEMADSYAQVGDAWARIQTPALQSLGTAGQTYAALVQAALGGYGAQMQHYAADRQRRMAIGNAIESMVAALGSGGTSAIASAPTFAGQQIP